MKKLLSLFLSLVMCLSSVHIVFADQTNAYGGGSGSEDDPYLITTEAELRLFANAVNDGNAYERVYFRLENDIKLSSSGSELQTNWNPIGCGTIDVSTKEFIDNGSNSFKGVFDGNGHTVSNVIISAYAQLDDTARKTIIPPNTVGFFGYTYNAVIKNLTVDGTIAANDRVGGIVGYAANGSYIQNCTNKASVYGENRIGGIVGYAGPGSATYSRKVIDGCTNEGIILSCLYIYAQKEIISQGVGGIAGYTDNKNTVIVNSINNGTVLSTYTTKSNTSPQWKNYTHFDGIGGIVGYMNAGTVERCINSGRVFGEHNTGGVVGTLGIDGEVVLSGSEPLAEEDSSNESDSGIIDGSDIRFTTPAAVFSLVIDMTNADKITQNDQFSLKAESFGGVVGENSGKVTECYAKNAHIEGMERVGGIVGTNKGTVEKSNIEDTYVRATSIEYHYTTANLIKEPFYAHLGGIVGYNTSEVNECTASTSTITSIYNAVGGIVGADDATASTSINKCKTANCIITSEEDFNISSYYNKYIGGIAGIGKNITSSQAESVIDNDSVILGHENVGGIVGRNIGIVDDCHNMSKITGNVNIGGIVGENTADSKITNCYNERFFSGKGSYLGGIAGLNRGTIENCYNTGAIQTGDGLFEHAGGIAGRNDIGGTLDKCYNKADISGKNNIGGVLGVNDNGTVMNCYNEGAISGQDKVGGIVGLNEWLSGSSETPKDAYIVNNFNKGAVEGLTDIARAGGISGLNQGYLDNCYNSGDVKYEEKYKGYRGLISGQASSFDDRGGTIYSKIMNCYSKEFNVPICGTEDENIIDSATVKTIKKSDESKTLIKLNDYVSSNSDYELVKWGYNKGEPELLLSGEDSNIIRVTLTQNEGGTIAFSDIKDNYKYIEKGTTLSLIITPNGEAPFSGLAYSGGFISVDDMTISENNTYTFKAPNEYDIDLIPIFGDGTFITSVKCLNALGNSVKKDLDTNTITKLSVGMTTTNTSLTPDIIAAAYDNSDNFMQIVALNKDCTFTGKKVVWDFDNVSVPVGASKIKLFAWESIGSMQPAATNIYTVYFEEAYVKSGLKLWLDSKLSKIEDNKWYNAAGDDYYTLNNVTVGDKFLSFDGSGSYAQSNDTVDMGSNPRTIEITLDNMVCNTSRNSYIFGMGSYDTSNFLIGLDKNNNIIVFSQETIYTLPYNISSVKSIAVAVGSTDFTVYVNGVIAKKFDLNINTSASKIMLGNSSNIPTPSRYMGADLYSVRIYNRVLSAEEIKANYATDTSRFLNN